MLHRSCSLAKSIQHAYVLIFKNRRKKTFTWKIRPKISTGSSYVLQSTVLATLDAENYEAFSILISSHAVDINEKQGRTIVAAAIGEKECSQC